LEEIEKELRIDLRPLSWPISMGKTFKGVYNLYQKSLTLFNPGEKLTDDNSIEIKDLNDGTLDKLIGEDYANTLRNDVELLEAGYPKLDKEEYLEALVSPVFFGSAVNNFGVRELLDSFIEIAPSPRPRYTETKEVQPDDKNFSGFVFKIHANLDPKHRDRIAFLRIVSGKFERNKNYFHVRENRNMKFSNPTAFMAQDKNVVDEAYPGDIIGLYDSSNFKIGDTLTEGEKFMFKGIPQFSPELFRYVVNKDPMKTKQLSKGLEQLTDEGVAQLFTKRTDNRKVLGTVGALQFEVIQHRLKSEYSASCDYESISLYKACWISSADKKKLEQFIFDKAHHMAVDKDGKPVFLAESAWALQMAEEKNPDIKFHFISEFKDN
jgi:peptide chain release factor 3